MRDALRKVARAINGVNNPGVRSRAGNRRRFLGKDAELRVFRRHIVQYQPLRGQVGVCYHIGAPFEADFYIGAETLHYQSAGAAGRRLTDGQRGMAASGTGQVVIGERRGHCSSISVESSIGKVSAKAGTPDSLALGSSADKTVYPGANYAVRPNPAQCRPAGPH